MTVVLEITETPGAVPVKMVKGASISFAVQLPVGMDLSVGQIECRIYENTPTGFAGPPALEPTVTKTSSRYYVVSVTALQSATLSIQKNYRWYFKKAVDASNTRHLVAGTWKVVAP